MFKTVQLFVAALLVSAVYAAAAPGLQDRQSMFLLYFPSGISN